MNDDFIQNSVNISDYWVFRLFDTVTGSLISQILSDVMVDTTLVPEAFIDSLQRNFATQTPVIIVVIGMKR